MSNLKVVGETEVQDAEPAAPARAEGPSRPSSDNSPVSAENPQTLALLEEIRRVLNARAGALLAMVGSFVLTGWAMYQGQAMSMGIAVSFDVFSLIPMLIIAYRSPRA